MFDVARARPLVDSCPPWRLHFRPGECVGERWEVVGEQLVTEHLLRYLVVARAPGDASTLGTLTVSRVAFDAVTQEREALTRLVSHPVPRVLGFGEVDGLPWLVSSRQASAQDLRVLLTRPSPDKVVWVLYALWALLRSMHGHGLVHRNLSLSSVLVEGIDDPISARSPIQLSSFEYCQIDGVTAAGIFPDSAYQSPEEWVRCARRSNAPVSPAADLFSFALVALSALSGDTFQYRDRTALGRFVRESQGRLAAHPLATPLLPSLTRLLDRQPEVRLEAAGEFGVALEALATRVHPDLPSWVGADVATIAASAYDAGASQGRRGVEPETLGSGDAIVAERKAGHIAAWVFNGSHPPAQAESAPVIASLAWTMAVAGDAARAQMLVADMLPAGRPHDLVLAGEALRHLPDDVLARACSTWRDRDRALDDDFEPMDLLRLEIYLGDWSGVVRRCAAWVNTREAVALERARAAAQHLTFELECWARGQRRQRAPHDRDRALAWLEILTALGEDPVPTLFVTDPDAARPWHPAAARLAARRRSATDASEIPDPEAVLRQAGSGPVPPFDRYLMPPQALLTRVLCECLHEFPVLAAAVPPTNAFFAVGATTLVLATWRDHLASVVGDSPEGHDALLLLDLLAGQGTSLQGLAPHAAAFPSTLRTTSERVQASLVLGAGGFDEALVGCRERLRQSWQPASLISDDELRCITAFWAWAAVGMSTPEPLDELVYQLNRFGVVQASVREVVGLMGVLRDTANGPGAATVAHPSAAEVDAYEARRDLASTALASSDFDTTLDIAKAHLRESPHSVSDWMLAATAVAGRGDWQVAADIALKVLQSGPAQPHAWQLYLNASIRSGRDVPGWLADKAVRLFPHDPDIVVPAAEVLVANGRIPAAVSALASLLVDSPASPEGWLLLSDLASTYRESQSALDNVALSPSTPPEAVRNAIVRLVRAGRGASLAHWYESRQPADVETLQVAATALWSVGQKGLATAAAARLIGIAPQDSVGLGILLQACVEERRWQDARHFAERLLPNGNPTVLTQLFMALAFLETGDPSSANALIELHMERPHVLQAIAGLGSGLLERGQDIGAWPMRDRIYISVIAECARVGAWPATLTWAEACFSSAQGPLQRQMWRRMAIWLEACRRPVEASLAKARSAQL